VRTTDSESLIRQPIAVVQIQRQGRWTTMDRVYADAKIKSSTTTLTAKLGKVTGVRVKYVSTERR
jgi:hypothetical protein